MEKFGNIEIRVVGQKGNIDLSPENYDVKEIISILQNVEDLLYPSNKRDRPTIAYSIEEGSVRHIFKTSIQAIIGFSAVLIQVNQSNSVDFLELKTAQAIENIQNFAYQKDYRFELKTSTENETLLSITPQTKFLRTENLWADAELYFYGTLTNAGGKSSVNIHIDTAEFGSITVDTDKEFLQGKEENLLYKQFGVRATGKQNVETGEIDKSSLKLIELVDYSPKYDEFYLNGLIQKAKNTWKGVDTDNWMNNIRGGYEA